MRIQHNIAALSASNYLKANDNAISKNIQKLSSGYRINSAADDAAGLAVSEKMRSQINGLNQAEDNAENGVSLVQTAEGGLSETSSILQRMNTLAVESANGTYQDDTDRANLQKEVTALQSEINTISSSTNFNQINLLDGTVGYTASFSSATVFSSVSISGLTVLGGNLTATTAAVALTISGGSGGTVTATTGSAVAGLSFSTVTTADGSGNYTVTAQIDFSKATTEAQKETLQKYDGLSVTFRTNSDYTASGVSSLSGGVYVTKNKELALQIGSDNKDDQRVQLAIGDMSTSGLGIQNIDISTQSGAESAIDTIQTAINTVSATRSDLGALQNRLEHTENNLSTMSENLTSAESDIRDVDMSDEYVQYSKNQILSQAATSMLAQANTQPQNVLTLLKG